MSSSPLYTTLDHDFRTPIISLKGFVDALRYADQDSRGALTDRVESNADHLLEMVEGLVEDDVLRAWASGVAMHRVVTNLVVNALKYSPSGTPVTVELPGARANEPADLAQRSTPSTSGRPWSSSPTGQPGG